MSTRIHEIRKSLVSKLIIQVGLALVFCLSVWAYFNINYQKKKNMEDIISSADTLTRTIKLGTHYAMMHNLRNDITSIIKSIAREKKLENIRIYNKLGQIKFSNQDSELDQTTNIKAEACYVCHRSDPPLSQLSLPDRTRIFYSPQGYRLLGILSPIYSEPGCALNACHVHPADKQVLGALDVVVSLKEADEEIMLLEKWLVVFALLVFLSTSAMITFFLLRFVRRPIKKIMDETHLIANGDYSAKIDVDQDDEMGQLSAAINKMGKKIGEKEAELNKQWHEYQSLFELVPCYVTVQDRNYKLVKYNREFSDKFSPSPGDYCYAAYKGRNKKCEICPVEKTFEDGRSHFSEEKGVRKDGILSHWIVKTTAIKDDEGQVVAAMEMCLDFTEKKLLEEELKKSEKKYYAIFNNIPNPVFVLAMDTLEILDCNASVKVVYGYNKDEIIQKSFLDLFKEEEKDHYAALLKNSTTINQCTQLNKSGARLFVNIRISPSEYPGRKVLLVTTSDITKRLETEQQLMQAGKMATLGEMATGVAHELNQPLSVIKTASRYFMKKVKKKEKIEDDILFTMADEIDSHVDRATNIIGHMRQFGRKSELKLTKVQVNDTLKRAHDILGQQLKVRGIEVIWDLESNLPMIMAEPVRLEQVFINLLINARDAIEERQQSHETAKVEKKITVETRSNKNSIMVTISDTGSGIPKAHLDKIFEPFFTTKKVGEGTGLGLSISYGIVQECKGTIKAAANEDIGTSFIMKFPRADEN
ncbi:MAG: PAS domain S-box protein [Deltaproteobacteria bacterium]|nr:MAG: PAS domain S-box protein [Deltaproteobacteria bacterium]